MSDRPKIKTEGSKEITRYISGRERTNMDLTLMELILLKETPAPAETRDETNSRSSITARALACIGDKSLTQQAVFRVLDQLVAKHLVERVSIGLLRRTFEGERSLVRNMISLQRIAEGSAAENQSAAVSK